MIHKIRSYVNQTMRGKSQVVDKILMAMLAGGHILLEDIPGVGKTTMALAFANSMGLDFKRVQFTPDVLPSDLVGFSMYNQNTNEMEYKPGALNCNLFLGDEINRASAKVQSALLEVMEEGRVTVDGVTRVVPNPFVVIATQNPKGSSGTHNLPESQLDRFMVRLSVGYPQISDEIEIMKSKNEKKQEINPIITAGDFESMKEAVANVFVHNSIYMYIARIAAASREDARLETGISPRGSIAICAMAKAKAFINGRDYVIPDDVMDVFTDVTAHRVTLSYSAKMEKKTAKEVLTEVLKSVKAPKVKE